MKNNIIFYGIMFAHGLFFSNHLHAGNVDVVSLLKNKETQSEKLKWVEDRAGNAESALQLCDASVEFPLPEVSENTLLEMWVRPDAWNTAGGSLIRISGEGLNLSLDKEKDRDILVFRSGDAVAGKFPIDHWGAMEWTEKQDRRLWHHVAILFAKGEVRLFVDGFPAGNYKTKVAGDLKVELLAPGTISYGGIYASILENTNSEDFRKRYLNLYRNVPAIDPQFVTIPKLREKPDFKKFLKTGELSGAAVIPGLLAWNDNKDKSAFPASTLLEEKITVFLARDEGKIYLAFRTPYAGKLPGEAVGKRDIGFWNQECFEVFVEPPWTGVSEYVQLVGMAHGDQTDLQLMNFAWDGEWSWEAEIFDNEWRGVMAIDLKKSGLPIPANGDIWGLNIFNLWANAAWSWSQRFHDNQAFGKMQFLDDVPAIVVGAPTVDDNMLQVPVRLEGAAAKYRAKVRLQQYAPGKPLPEQEAEETVSGKVSEVIVRTPYEQGTESLFVVQVQDDAGRVLYNQSFSLPMISSLKRPELAASAPAKEEAKDEEKREWSAAELGEMLQQSREWFGNSIGKTEGVPANMQPLEVKDGSISLWNRQYHLGETLFLSQAVSNGKELLKNPVGLRVKTEKKEFVIEDAKTSIVEKTAREVRVIAEKETGGMLVHVESRVSFDGMIWYQLKISPSGKPLKIESLHLQIPMRSDQAKLFNLTSSLSGHPPGSDSGGISDSPMTLDFLREILWIGTPREGLTWIAEDLRGWPIVDEQGIQAITPKNGSVLLDIKLGEKFVLQNPVTFEFGLQATPVKARPKDFRKMADRSHIRWSWDWGEGDYYPFHDHPEMAREIIAKEREAGREVMPASSVHFFGEYRFDIPPKPFPERPNGGLMHRENLLYAPLWMADELNTRSAPGVLPATQAATGDWRGRGKPRGQFRYNPASSFQDFYLWKLDRAVRETGLGAIYLDQPLIRVTNRLAGAGYSGKDGQWMPTVPLLGMRNMLERMYNVFQKAHGKSLIRWHCSNQMVIPVFPYIDVFWDGENYGHSRSKVFEFYSKLLSPEKMQVQHTGLPFGFTPSLLPEFEGRYAPSPASVRDMLGVFLIHDSHVWDSHSQNLDIVRSVNKKWLDFPYEKTTTHYYWDEDQPLQINAREVYAVLHQGDDFGRVIAFNWSDEPKEVSLTFTTPGIHLNSVTDVETGKSPLHTKNEISTVIPPRDFRMYDFKK